MAISYSSTSNLHGIVRIFCVGTHGSCTLVLLPASSNDMDIYEHALPMQLAALAGRCGGTAWVCQYTLVLVHRIFWCETGPSDALCAVPARPARGPTKDGQSRRISTNSARKLCECERRVVAVCD